MNGLTKKYLAELVGTFILCFIGAGAIVSDTLFNGVGLLAIAVAHGLALSVAVSGTMNISGGHINPAVTIVMLVTGRISLGNATAYIVSQLIGAVVAGIAVMTIFQAIPGGGEAITTTGLGTPMPGSGVSIGTVLLTEIVLTFMLTFAVFSTAVDSRSPQIAGFGIGLTLAASILIGGPISGASLNPARTFGTGLIGGVWSMHWVYWVGPIVGALIAGMLYHYFILRNSDR